MKCSSRCNREAVPGKTKCEPCLESARRYAKKRYAGDPEYRVRIKAQREAWDENNKEQRRENARRTMKALFMRRKLEAIKVYGGECACCGETRHQFLTLDHAHGDGAAHRQELVGASRRAGSGFLHALARKGYPPVPGLRIMCFNCHMAEDLWGGCPHQAKAIIEDRAGDPDVEALR